MNKMQDFKVLCLGTPWPGTAVSKGPGTLKESEKSPKGCPEALARGAPESPKSAPRSPRRVQKESEAAFWDSFRTPGRTLWGLWLSRAGGPGTLFGTLFGLFWDSGPEGPGDLCARSGGSQYYANTNFSILILKECGCCT